MILQGLALAALMSQCAPNVSPSTMAAIVQVESGGNPFAIDDNTTRRAYYPRSRRSAAALAHRLLQAGHLIDAGIAQIDSMNYAHLGLSTESVFDPCMNLQAGATILAADYRTAVRYFGDGQVALRHAIGMYNTGRLDRGAGYVRKVLAAAGVRDTSANPLVIAKRRAMRSSVLVSVRGGLGVARRVARTTSARAPILVSSVSHIVVF